MFTSSENRRGGRSRPVVSTHHTTPRPPFPNKGLFPVMVLRIVWIVDGKGLLDERLSVVSLRGIL